MFLQLCVGVVVFETCLFHAQSHVTLTALKNFFCHTPGLTHMTPQLHLRPGRPMLADADFEPSDVRFKIRWSPYWPWYSPFWSRMCQHIPHEGTSKISM